MRDAAERNRRQIMSDIGAEKANLVMPDVERKQAPPLGGRAIPEAQGDPNLHHLYLLNERIFCCYYGACKINVA